MQEPDWSSEADTVPEVRPADGFTDAGCRGIYLDGPVYRGAPTRVFGVLGLPQGATNESIPGVVLVHGGGGTAFPRWVAHWNARGYAALAIDTCGCVFGGSHNCRPRHPWGGPAGWGGFDSINEPVNDQWTYQAVAATLRARSVLAVQPGVDPNRIGVTGVSWGGFLTCIAASVTDRFACAASVYGCGLFGVYQDAVPELTALSAERRVKWWSLWDPSMYLPFATTPFLWVNSQADPAYPLPAWQRSRDLANRHSWGVLHRDLIHSHQVGADIEEVSRFFDYRFRNGPALIRAAQQTYTDDTLHVAFDNNDLPRRAFLHVTSSDEPWQLKRWSQKPLHLESDGVHIRTNGCAAYVEFIDGDGMITCSDVWFKEEPAPLYPEWASAHGLSVTQSTVCSNGLPAGT